MTVRRALVAVSRRWIEDLTLPKGSKIVDILPVRDCYRPNDITFVVEHEKLEEVQEGEQYPLRSIKGIKDKIDVPVMDEYHFEWDEP